MTDDVQGYIDFFAILGLDAEAKPGEVRKEYRKRMKDLVNEIASVEITEDRRARYLLEMAKLNAAYYVLRDREGREAYWSARERVIQVERAWREAAAQDAPGAEQLRRDFDRTMREFLSKYVEETMLEAGRDKEVVEASNWDLAHERHAFRILRAYRQSMYQAILARLPYVEVTSPRVDWDERGRFVAAAMKEGG